MLEQNKASEQNKVSEPSKALELSSVPKVPVQGGTLDHHSFYSTIVVLRDAFLAGKPAKQLKLHQPRFWRFTLDLVPSLPAPHGVDALVWVKYLGRLESFARDWDSRCLGNLNTVPQ